MVGSNVQTWDLHIANVQPADEGLYQCQILASNKSEPMRSDYAKLTVLSKPRSPILTSGPRFVVRDDTRGSGAPEMRVYRVHMASVSE